MIPHTYSQDDFELFRDTVNSLIHRMGLTEWTYDVRQEQIENGAQAQVSYNCVSKQALFSMAETVLLDFGLITNPKKLALHEVLHLLIADLTWACAIGGDSADLSVSHEHEAINRLMRVIEP